MRLNLNSINKRFLDYGLSPAGVAKKISVSRESISKWLNDESIPRPKHLLALGRLLKLKYDELVIEDAPQAIISFRHHSDHCHLVADEKKALQTAQMLQQLVPYITKRTPEQPLRLRNPQCTVEYVEEICGVLRERYNWADEQPIPLKDLVSQAFKQDAILVPALWGRNNDSDNGLSIYQPQQGITWIFLNLDARQCDFRYWLSHELAHAYTVESHIDTETFAELFAQHLLFPDKLAEKLYNKLKDKANAEEWHTQIQQMASSLEISSRTVQHALLNWTTRKKKTNPLADDVHLVTAKKTDDLSVTLFQSLFGKNNEQINCLDYFKKTIDMFGDTFWRTLQNARQADKITPGCIQQILKNSCIDAKEIWANLSAI